MQKRTKNRGLGDTIAQFTHFFGIDRLATWFATKILGRQDCGCERRQNWLNRLFPYKKNKVYDAKDIFTSKYFGPGEADDSPHPKA